MPELIAPSARLHSAWLEAHAEWGPGTHEDGFGLHPSDEVGTPEGFAAWLARLAGQSHPATTTDVGRHRCTYRWIVEGGRVLGGIALRDGDDDYVSWAGHVGYGIRPSASGPAVSAGANGLTAIRPGPSGESSSRAPVSLTNSSTACRAPWKVP